MGLLTDEQRQVIDEIEQAMIKSPLEFRTGMNMNRQQFKQMQREMNKYQQALSKLTPTQAKAMNMFIEQKATEYKSQYKVFDEQFQTVLDRCISAMLIQLLPDNSLDDIQRIEEHLGRMMAEDTHKQKEFFVGEKEKVMELSKRLTEEVEMYIIGRLEERDLEVRQKVLEKFPQLSAAMMENACKKTFENWKKAKGDMLMNREQGKVLVKEMLETGVSAKEIKNELKFEFPTMSNKDVEKLYKEAKKEYDQEHLKDTETGAEEILNIIEDSKKSKKTTKKDKVTMTKEAGEQLEEIVEELKAEGKAIEIAIKEVPEGEAQKEIEEIKEEIEERFMPTEVQSTSITEQLKGKLVLFEGKKTALSNDIANCEAKIKELENIIKEKHKGIAEYQVKAKNVEQMLELAKNIEE